MRPTTTQIRRRRWTLALVALVVVAGAWFAHYHLVSVPAKADAAAYAAGWVIGDGAALRGGEPVDRVCPSAWIDAGNVPHAYDHRAQIETGCADAFAEVARGR